MPRKAAYLALAPIKSVIKSLSPNPLEITERLENNIDEKKHKISNHLLNSLFNLVSETILLERLMANAFFQSKKIALKLKKIVQVKINVIPKGLIGIEGKRTNGKKLNINQKKENSPPGDK